MKYCHPYKSIYKSLLIIILVVFLSYVSGCSNSPKEEVLAAETKLLRIGSTLNIKQINPLTDYYYNILAMLMTHDSLVHFDPDLQVVPQLAQSWECLEGGKLWKFRLVPDARWHDGYPVSATDVKFTFKYLALHNPSAGWIADLVEDIQTDDTEVIFRLKKPYSRFLINAGFVVRILPKHIWEEIDSPLRINNREITTGCGPFIFNSFNQKANKICFDVNKNYYGVIPDIERIEFHLYQNMDALTLALLKKKIDVYYKYASGYPVQYLKKIIGNSNLELAEADSMGIPAALGFNMKHKPLDKLDIRKAIALSINYKRINQCLFGGKGRVPGAGFVPPVFPFWIGLSELTYNPQESRRLLSSSGLVDNNEDGILELPEGKKLSLTLLSRADLGDTQLVKLLKHDLKAVGLDLVIQSTDLSTWIAFLQNDRYDLVLFRTTPWGMMMHAGYSSGYFDSRRKGGGTIGNLTDSDFFSLCDRILATTEPSSSKRLYHELQAYYARHLPAIALSWSKNIYPFHKNWQGFRIHQLEGGLANRFSWRFLKFVELPDSGE